MYTIDDNVDYLTFLKNRRLRNMKKDLRVDN